MTGVAASAKRAELGKEVRIGRIFRLARLKHCLVGARACGRSVFGRPQAQPPNYRFLVIHTFYIYREGVPIQRQGGTVARSRGTDSAPEGYRFSETRGYRFAVDKSFYPQSFEQPKLWRLRAARRRREAA